MKAFLTFRIRKFVIFEAFVKSLDKSDFLDLINFDFLDLITIYFLDLVKYDFSDLTKFIIVDRF